MNKFSKSIGFLVILFIAVAASSCSGGSLSNPSVSLSLSTPDQQSLSSQTSVVTPSPSNISVPAQSGTTVGKPFLPGDVLAELPVYPGAVGTTWVNPGFGPPSFPSEMPIYGSNSPGYQSASVQYTVQASEEDILGWYKSQLAAKGYRSSGEDIAGNATLISHSIPFFLPSQPLISVQIHVYNMQNTLGSSVFELLVIYTVPLPKPLEESLPNDIEGVQIDFAPGTANHVVKTITDMQAVTNLAGMVNNLPVRPDYIITGGPMGGQTTLFRLVFHSKTKGDITVTDDIIQGIQMNDYPSLDDPHGLLKELVGQLVGISSP